MKLISVIFKDDYYIYLTARRLATLNSMILHTKHKTILPADKVLEAL